MVLISGAEVDSGKELSVIDYIDEMGLTIRPVVEILYEIDEEQFITGGRLKNLIFGTLGQWDQINRFFLEHNRSVMKKKTANRKTILLNEVNRLDDKDIEKMFDYLLTITTKPVKAEMETTEEVREG